MGFLQKLFGSKPAAETAPVIEGYRIVYGQEAYLEARRADLWQISETGVSVCSIDRDPPSARSGSGRTHDLLISLRLQCRRHGKQLRVASESVFGAQPSSRAFDLPCGCCSKYDLAVTGSGPIFVWSYDELLVEDIREAPLIPRGLTFAECPNCRNTVEAGSGRHFDIVQCLGCGARYCYNCWHKEYLAVTCPRCGATANVEVGAVRAG